MPFLHIIVLGYGRFNETSRLCLESLLPIPEYVEVTVFDNGSLDSSPVLQEAFVKDHPEIRSVLSQTNLGFAAGMNAAVASNAAPHEWLMLVGNDTIFHPQALQIMIDAMKTAPDHVGIIGPMTNSAGNAQELRVLGDQVADVFKIWDKNIIPLEPVLSPLYRADFFCVAIKKSVWDRLGGLSISYGKGYYEDFDFCLRSRHASYEPVMLENALVYHQGSASFKNDSEQAELIKINKMIFLSQFPNVELRHRRLDQYKTLEHYLNQKYEISLKSYISQLVELRIQSLLLDLPKSPIKKLIWKSKITSISKKLARFKNSI
jgi:GT2 family glycosyltransferase